MSSPAVLGSQRTNTTRRLEFTIEGAGGASLAGLFTGEEQFSVTPAGAELAERPQAA